VFDDCSIVFRICNEASCAVDVKANAVRLFAPVSCPGVSHVDPDMCSAWMHAQIARSYVRPAHIAHRSEGVRRDAAEIQSYICVHPRT